MEHPTIEPHFCGLDVPGQRCWECPRLTTIQKYRPDEAFEESDFQRYWKFAVFEGRQHLVETCFSHSYTPSDLFLAPSIWCQHRSQVVERVNLFYPVKVVRWRLPFLRDHHAKGLLAVDLQSFVRRSVQNEVQEPLKAFFWISNECRVICVPDVVDTDTVDGDSVVRFLEPSEYALAVQVEEVRTHHAALTYPAIDFGPPCQAVWKLDDTLLEVIAGTHFVDNLFHTLMVLWENENFLTSNLLCFFTSVKLCPLVILLCFISKKILESIYFHNHSIS